MNLNPNTASASAPLSASPAAAASETQHVSVLPSAELLRGQKVVAIDHNGSLYRLQTTRQGKLILTK
ncbi:hemin uptake protein HemP [Hydrogenophaga sp. BPS33]|uniref:hemin uptake protein HemP n=1 Tax=Hydrogenophaga sp. BPS33 TaxID=2651974 RepID=UPI00131F8F71|nr:hemin uptake protein HemP [Hydrogenophaga sp. BPS33]QHE86720.1 hemin uptake protein HemP [Hydrogenophaga sp. BPS33]